MSVPRQQPMRVLVVDDEPLAREALRALLDRDDEVEVVGEAGDGRSAVEAIRSLGPDLVLLDVSMPEMDGFEVLERLGNDAPPDTIFVTAYDHHAVRAFEVHAVDYLLKPVGRERFRSALDRAKRRVRRGSGATTLLRDLKRSGALGSEKQLRTSLFSTRPPPRLAVRSAGRIRFVRPDAIDWIEAADYYAKLHVGGGSYLIRRSMGALEEDLDPVGFARIHRSAIVNLDRVREIRPRLHGGHTVILSDGTRLRLSRGRRRVLQDLLSNGA